MEDLYYYFEHMIESERGEEIYEDIMRMQREICEYSQLQELNK